MYRIGNEYLEISKKLAKKKGDDLTKIQQENNINTGEEEDKKERLFLEKPQKRAIYTSHLILNPGTVSLQSSLLDPRRVDQVRKLQQDVRKVSEGKDDSKVDKRISLMQNQGYNDYLRAKHSTNTSDYLREVEKGDKKLLGVLNSKLNLLKTIQKNHKNSLYSKV